MYSLSEQQLVSLSPPDLPRLYPFEAYVVALDQRVVWLHALAREALTWLPPEVDDVMLLFETGGRRIALNGVLRYEASTQNLRFRILDRTFVPTWRASRLQFHAPVSLVGLGADGEGEAYEGLSYDIAADGLLLQPEGPPPPVGEHLVRLSLPGEDTPVVARGVVRAEGQDRPVVQFSAIAPLERARIRAFVSKQLRDRLVLIQATESFGDDDYF